MSRTRLGFVVNTRVATKFICSWATTPRRRAKREISYDDMRPFSQMTDCTPHGLKGVEESIEDKVVQDPRRECPRRTMDCTPQGLGRGTGFGGTRKTLKIWWCGMLGGNSLVANIGFTSPFTPLRRIEAVSPA